MCKQTIKLVIRQAKLSSSTVGTQIDVLSVRSSADQKFTESGIDSCFHRISSADIHVVSGDNYVVRWCVGIGICDGYVVLERHIVTGDPNDACTRGSHIGTKSNVPLIAAAAGSNKHYVAVLACSYDRVRYKIAIDNVDRNIPSNRAVDDSCDTIDSSDHQIVGIGNVDHTGASVADGQLSNRQI